jgi:hypothetical protein
VLLAWYRSSRISAIDRVITRRFQDLLVSLDDSSDSLDRLRTLLLILGRLLNGDSDVLIQRGEIAAGRRLATARLQAYMGCLARLWRIGRNTYLIRRQAMAGDVWDFQSLWSSRVAFWRHMLRLAFAGLCYWGRCRRLGFRIASAAIKRLSLELWPEFAHAVE